jgi:hypothetical protein
VLEALKTFVTILLAALLFAIDHPVAALLALACITITLLFGVSLVMAVSNMLFGVPAL